MLTVDEHEYIREQLYIRVGGVGSVRATLAGALPVRLRIKLPDSLLPEGLVAEAIQICVTDDRSDTPPAICFFLRQMFPTDARIKLIIAKIEQTPLDTTAGADPFAAKVLFNRIPFLGRLVARGYLRALLEDMPQQPIVVINGPHDSGKTYTTEFVKHIRWFHKGILPCHIRVEKGQGESIGAGELARDLTTLLSGDIAALPRKEDTNASRWPQELANQIVSFATRTQHKCWLILDGFNDVELEKSPETRQLIASLSHVLTSGTAQKLHRLVLLDFTAANLLNPVGTLAIENIPALPLSFVEEFVREVAASKLPDDIQLLIASVTQGLPDPVVDLTELGRRLTDLIQLIG
ncbi:hypothetical protein [Bradyrhizobium sp. USDA 3364]